jgi:putative nucleotidyltransferase with HDIG domain
MENLSIGQIEKAFFNALPFPPVLYKLLSMVREEKESLFKIGKEISKDAVLSAKILETANSPLYGFKRKISDLPHAISLLGYKEVSATVMRFVLKRTLSSAEEINKSRLYPSKDIWRHSLKTALISKALAQQFNFPYPLECYTAGLLHDIGKNAISLSIERRLEYKIFSLMNSSNNELFEAEKDILGFDHVQCGIRILKKLKISFEIMQSVHQHHSNLKKDFSNMAFILALSNVLAKFEQYDKEVYDEMNLKLDTQFDMCSVEIQGLDKIYESVERDLEHIL